MGLTQSVINELAVAWMRLHRTAAQPHLEFMIKKMQQSDCDGAADYRRVLDAVRARQSAKGGDRSTGQRHIGDSDTRRSSPT